MNSDVHSTHIPTQPPLAIVGLSALFPMSDDLDQFWSNIRRGVDAITEVPATHWNPDDYFDSNQKSPDMTYARRGGFLSPVPFDPLEYGISPNNLEAIDTSQLLGMVGAKRALEHAGYGADRKFDRSRVGCILGVTGTLEMVIPLGARLGHPRWRKALKDAGVPDDVADDVVQRISDSYVPWQENSFPGLLGNVVAGRIANRLDLHGTNCVVDAACASSLSAIHLAALELWTGRSDMVVTGGIDTFNDIFMYMCFSKTPALSPTGDAKPFSEEADGTILGEGVGILVLKRLADAERDGDRIYAVLRGIGTSSDGAGNAVYAPKADGQIRCLHDAYRVAGVSPDTIELVEAHGTGTKVGDATEVSGLIQVYKSTGRRGPWCAVGSIKSQIGHTKAAAGAAGVIKAILALQHRVLPPTIKVNQPPAALLSEDSPLYVNTEARPWMKPSGHPRRAAVSAFGFGGSNFHCVLEESPQRFDIPDWDGDVQIVALSAENTQPLAAELRSWSEPQEWEQIRRRAGASRAAFRTEASHRLLLVIERDKTDIARLVASALTMLEKYTDRNTWSTPDGAFYGRGHRSGRLGVLFPGQGSQYVGMQRDLACMFPVMNDVLTEANDVFASRADANGKGLHHRLSDFIYPVPSWSPAERDQKDNELRATQNAQPAIGAVSLGVLSILDQFGVCPEAAAGHSYGELTALCASRRFAPRTLYRLSMLRGRLMAEAQSVEGGMLAIGAPLTQVEAAIKEMAVDLVVANNNSPNQVVLSGRIPEIDRASQLFSQRNLRGKRLQVAAAFHSPLVATASRAFRPELDDVEFAPSQMPVYANSTAHEYPIDPSAARDLLASQLARPVNFVNEIEQMFADGVRTFLEVGPGSVLTGLVNSILSGREFRAIAIDSSNGRRGGVFDLAHALAQLSASGHSVRLDAWDSPGTHRSEPRPSNRLRIPICGANYVKPRTPLPPRPPLVAKSRPAEVAAPPAEIANEPVFPAPMISDPVVNRRPAISALIGSPDSPIMESSPPPAPPPVPTIASHVEPMPSAGPAKRVDADTQAPLPASVVETIQDHLQVLQRIQEETALVHQRFLESQEAALRTFEELARRQLDVALQRETRNAERGTQSENQTGQVVSSAASNPSAAASNPVLSTQSSVLSPEARNAERGTLSETATPAAPAPAASFSSSSTLRAPSSQFGPPSSALVPIVMAVVSEKTGYPTEMFSLEMSLDHDLGIDSIKRVEILSALQERVPELPAFKPEELGALHTLNDVVMLAETRNAERGTRSETATLVAPAPAASASSSSEFRAPSSALVPIVMAVVSEKTGYPTEMLSLEMSLDHDLGIDSIKRVEILSALQERVPELPAFKPEELGALHTLNDVVMLAETRNVERGTRSEAATPIAPSPATNASSSSEFRAPSSEFGPPSSALVPIVMAVVSEKTGYPTEMLSLEMSLDHDLGIDSIKRVEILSALQERVPDLPAFKPEELGALHTLNDVVMLAQARNAERGTRSETQTSQVATVTTSSSSVAAPNPILSTQYPVLSAEARNAERGTRSETATPVASAPAASASSSSELRAPRSAFRAPNLIRSIVTIQNLPPVESQRELASVRGAEIWITEDGLELSLRIAAELSRRGFKPRVVDLDEPLAAIPERLAGLIVVSPAAGTNDRHLWRAIEWLQRTGPALRRTATLGATVFATVSRMNGRFGLETTSSLTDPVSGGLAGLVKSAAREWPDLHCKAFDLSDGWSSTGDAAAALIDELFRQGPVEIGLAPNQHCTPVVLEESLNSVVSTNPDIHPGDLVIVSGGARGVTAAAALAVARKWKPRLVILGRSPEPPEEPEWLKNLTSEPQIKQALIAILPRGTLPKAIESQYRQILAGREIAMNLAQLRATGVEVSYHAVDVRDMASVRPLLLQLQRNFGPIRGLIHGAGVLADQRIEDKTREQFDRVYQTKVAGLRNLLSAIPGDELRILGLFSSYTARYGRIGQCDYAIANEVLNKLAGQFAVEHPRTHVVSFNWGPWDGGMVTGGLKKLFVSEDVGLIPLQDGADLLVEEFSQSTSRPIEVLVLGNNGNTASTNPVTVNQPHPVRMPTVPGSSNILLTGEHQIGARQTANPDLPQPGSSNVLLAADLAGASRPVIPAPAQHVNSSNVLLTGVPAARSKEQPAAPPGPSGSWVYAEIGQTQAAEPGEMKLAFERTLDVRQYPFLESHVIGGKAVLPVAVILEWLAHGAIHHNPGLELEGFDDFRVFQGVRLGRETSATLRVLVGKPSRNAGRFVIRTQLIGTANGRDLVHAAGTVILTAACTPEPVPSLQVTMRSYSLDMATAYATRLFHGMHLQGIAAVEACSSDGIVVDSRTSPAPWAWMREPLRTAWIADPLSIDASLQAVILWSQEIRGIPCLPCSIGAYRQYRKVYPHTGVKIVVQVTQATDHAIRADVEFLDLQGLLVAQMSGCESIADASLVAAFKRNKLD